MQEKEIAVILSFPCKFLQLVFKLLIAGLGFDRAAATHKI
jgi:hypothetical protein